MKLNAKFKALLAFAAIAVGLTACGGGSGDTQSSQNSGAATVAAIKEKGVIRIGVFGDKPRSAMLTQTAKTKALTLKSPKTWLKTCSAAQTKSSSS